MLRKPLFPNCLRANCVKHAHAPRSRRLLLERLDQRLLLVADNPITVPADLGGEIGVVFQGVAAGDDAGRAVSSAGDVNGDGFDDLLIGADGADSGGELSGASYVVFGRRDPFPDTFDLATLDGSNGFVLQGDTAFDRAGLAVSKAGDFNGDGFGDLIVAAIESDGGGDRRGQTYLIFGNATAFPAAIDLGLLQGTIGVAIDGANDQDFSGVSVAGGGDFNGDGLDDLIIGAAYADPGGRDKAGSAFVLFGTQGSIGTKFSLASLDGTNGFVIEGAGAGELAGIAVDAAGDVNGDGLDDVIVGAYDAGPNGASSGAAYVVFGRAGDSPASLNATTLDGTNGFAIHGVDSGDALGNAVAGAGDVNGDGFADVLIGASNASPGGRSTAGSTYVVLGSDAAFAPTLELSSLDGSDGFVVNGVDPEDESGVSIDGVGDANGDGFDDLVIGARYANPNGVQQAGESYVLFGGGGFDASIELSGLDGTNGFRVDGASESGLLGLAVSGGGDVNGDGLADIVVAAPAADPASRMDAGETYLLLGTDYLNTITHQGDAEDNALVGDTNANIIVGAQGNDTLTSGGGADVLLGAEGDDEFILADSSFRKLTGGLGFDSVRVEGNGVTIDLTEIADSFLTGIEHFDITGDGGNALVLNLTEVLNLSETSNSLIIRADENDSVNLGQGWTPNGVQTVADEFYDVFQQGIAEVLVLRTVGPTWQNQTNPLDVNNDGFVVPLDVLQVINEVEARVISDANGLLPVPPVPPNLPPPFVDTTGDGFVTPLDALVIINFLNDKAEGETSVFAEAGRFAERLPRAKTATTIARGSDSAEQPWAVIAREIVFSNGLAAGDHSETIAEELLDALSL